MWMVVVVVKQIWFSLQWCSERSRPSFQKRVHKTSWSPMMIHSLSDDDDSEVD
jgi:hypothetical protein